MITVTIERKPAATRGLARAVAQVPDEFAPALRSAVDELRYVLGTRLEEMKPFAREDALTRAAAAVGALASALNLVIPKGDEDYAERAAAARARFRGR